MKDCYGQVIAYHDLCRMVSTNEVLIIDKCINDDHQKEELMLVSQEHGLGDLLSVYPEGILEIVGHLETV